MTTEEWVQRRKDYRAGKYMRRVVENKPKNLHWDLVKLECGHEYYLPAYDEWIEEREPWNCGKCANADE